MTRLSRLTIRGFRSIRNLEGFELRNLTVLIGPNGSGKSNFIAFFRMLDYAMTGQLQMYIARYGGGNANLFEGAEVTPQLVASLVFETERGSNEYFFRLVHVPGDTLVFEDEEFEFAYHDPYASGTDPYRIRLRGPHREIRIDEEANEGNRTARLILGFLKQCKAYQFHNTGEMAPIRQKQHWSSDYYLRSDGANLAPFLLNLKEQQPKYYARIIRTIRQIQPEFSDFDLVVDNGTVYLRWFERNSLLTFGAHQASDGSLRAIALATLLLQPEDKLPQVIFIDEPELGLHPHALNVIAGLIRSVATSRQVILATQSTTLLDYFDPADIVVVDRLDGASTFRRLDPKALEDWLDDYSMAELWEKNVIAGTP